MNKNERIRSRHHERVKESLFRVVLSDGVFFDRWTASLLTGNVFGFWTASLLTGNVFGFWNASLLFLNDDAWHFFRRPMRERRLLLTIQQEQAWSLALIPENDPSACDVPRSARWVCGSFQPVEVPLTKKQSSPAAPVAREFCINLKQRCVSVVHPEQEANTNESVSLLYCPAQSLWLP